MSDSTRREQSGKSQRHQPGADQRERRTAHRGGNFRFNNALAQQRHANDSEEKPSAAAHAARRRRRKTGVIADGEQHHAQDGAVRRNQRQKNAQPAMQQGRGEAR